MNNFKKYASYKDSEIEWASHIPSHWEVLKLKHIFLEKKIKHNPSLNCGSISYGEVVYKNDESVPESTKASYQEVLVGEFLINPLNLNYDLKSLRIALSDLNVLVSSGYIVLKNHLEIDKRYYKYLLHIYDIAYMKLLGSGVRQTINFNHISSSLLAYPPLPEQTAIANFLDKKTAEIKEFIALKEKTIELLKERKMAIINELVTGKKVWNGTEWAAPTEVKDSGIEWLGKIPKDWEVKKLKYFIDFVNRGSTPNYVEKSESKVVNQATFSRGFWNESEIKFTLIKSPDDARGLLIENDILMASTGGGLLGKVGFFPISEGNYIADSHVTIIRDSKKRIIPMLYYYLFSTLYSWIDGTLSKGSTNQIELQKDLLRGSKFPIPTIEVQNKIVEQIEVKLKELDDLINQSKNEISLIKEYQQSLISEVVTGKVDVRENNEILNR